MAINQIYSKFDLPQGITAHNPCGQARIQQKIQNQDSHYYKISSSISYDDQKLQSTYNDPLASLYLEIRNEINANQNTLLSLILNKYFRFLEFTFATMINKAKESLSKQDRLFSESGFLNISISEYSMSLAMQNSRENPSMMQTQIQQNTPQNPRCLFLPLTNYSQECIRKVLLLQSKQTIVLLVQSLVKMVTIVRLFIIVNFSQKLQSNLSRSPEALVTNEMFVQRLAQYFLFLKGSIVQAMIKPLLCCYYSTAEHTHELSHQGIKGSMLDEDFASPYQPEALDQSLVPRAVKEFDFSDEKENMQCQSMYLMARRLSSPGQSLLRLESSHHNNNCACENLREIIQKTIQQSENQIEQRNIPYFQTFKLLKELCGEYKFWRIFRLIESLDQMIVDIFLYKRSQSQQDKLLNIIYAEESKSDIMLFILFKFKQSNPMLNLRENLLIKIKFMMDHDEILHFKIKNLFSPAFLRFHQILEMIISSMNLN